MDKAHGDIEVEISAERGTLGKPGNRRLQHEYQALLIYRQMVASALRGSRHHPSDSLHVDNALPYQGGGVQRKLHTMPARRIPAPLYALLRAHSRRERGGRGRGRCRLRTVRTVERGGRHGRNLEAALGIHRHRARDIYRRPYAGLVRGE